MKMLVTVWTSAFVGWDLAGASEAARDGDHGLAAVFVGMAAVTVFLGVVAYRQMRVRA